MTGASDPQSVPLRPASTVMLVRDVPSDIEVFMLQRTTSAVFASGMYVFPGGRVDDVDAAAELDELCDGMSDAEASDLLRVPSGGLAYWVAAIRECFEEAGVLLARDQRGEYVSLGDTDAQARFGELRHRVHDGQLSLAELCRRENLRLAVDAIRYVSHWITPVGEKRRFDTRFFVAVAPSAQDPLHDDKETVASLWVTPSDALSRAKRGELAMIPPTIANLEFLAPHHSSRDAVDAAQRIGVPTPILPKLQFDGDGRVVGIVFPDDPRYAKMP
ncbi:MAG: NUDIX hydrolase [Actinomycetota bacterium]|jgi:8-oxo-dGTP pyrophosphatase MutT (NUDIX family)